MFTVFMPLETSTTLRIFPGTQEDVESLKALILISVDVGNEPFFERISPCLRICDKRQTFLLKYHLALKYNTFPFSPI